MRPAGFKALAAAALLLCLHAGVARARTAALLWEDELTQAPKLLTVAGPFLVVRFESRVKLYTWEDATAMEGKLSVPFVGVHNGVYRHDTPDGNFEVKVDMDKDVLTLSGGQKPVEIPLKDRPGNFNRAVPGPEGRSVMMYRFGEPLRVGEPAVFEWINSRGDTLVKYQHDRPAPEARVFFSGGERYVCVLDQDRLLVFSREGLLRDLVQPSWDKGLARVDVLLSEALSTVVLFAQGQDAWARAWDLNARELFRVHVPQDTRWHYTEGAPFAVGLPVQGGQPLLMDMGSGDITPVQGLRDATLAGADPTGKMLAVVQGNHLRVYLLQP